MANNKRKVVFHQCFFSWWLLLVSFASMASILSYLKKKISSRFFNLSNESVQLDIVLKRIRVCVMPQKQKKNRYAQDSQSPLRLISMHSPIR